MKLILAVLVCTGTCLAQGLFQPTKVWDVHLTFSPEQYRGLQPTPGGGGVNFGHGEWLQGKPGKRNGLASAMGVEFKNVHAVLTLDGHRLDDIAVRYKGNGTYLDAQPTAKFSFKIDLNKFVKTQAFDGVTKLNLHNNITDPSWMN